MNRAAAPPPLSPTVAELAQRARAALERGEIAAAENAFAGAAALQGAHPRLFELRGLLDQAQGQPVQAVEALQHARAGLPEDAEIANHLGAALASSGRLAEAIAAFHDAVRLDPTLLGAWFNLGRALEMSGDVAAACAAFDHALALDPRHAPSRVLRAEALKVRGRLDDAEAELRRVLHEDSASVAAWVALSNLKKSRFADAELERVAQLLGEAGLSEAQRIDLGFAHAAMLEANARYADAFAAFRAANDAKRRHVRWSAKAVSALVEDILVQFGGAADAAADDAFGSEAIFLVGMPRSGSTLAEQILAAHPDVEGGGEREDIVQLLQLESRRRGQRFPLWVRDASPADWRRLGADYLARSARWRSGRARFADKTLTNWQTLGAIRRMLPGARIVQCQRDPLETCWSCYKHHFGDAQFFTYRLDELVAFHRDCVHAMREWSSRHPGWIYAHRHEALLDDAEGGVRALLAHCGLGFDERCLRFHELDRDVRTASAAQVRQPLQRGGGVAQRYGTLLDPLRRALAD